MQIRQVIFKGTQAETQRFIMSFDNLNDDISRMKKSMDALEKRQIDLCHLINMLWMELKNKKLV
jgi:hypothetical protein